MYRSAGCGILSNFEGGFLAYAVYTAKNGYCLVYRNRFSDRRLYEMLISPTTTRVKYGKVVTSIAREGHSMMLNGHPTEADLRRPL